MEIVNLFVTLVVTGIVFIAALATLFWILSVLDWFCGVLMKLGGRD